jgi:hypothetical protein
MAPVAPAIWCGWQPNLDGLPPYALWNLTQDIPGHCAGSTVVSRTLERAGYIVEEPPYAHA